jgi:hypothetical protein
MRTISGVSVLLLAFLPACEQAADIDDDLVAFADRRVPSGPKPGAAPGTISSGRPPDFG